MSSAVRTTLDWTWEEWLDHHRQHFYAKNARYSQQQKDATERYLATRLSELMLQGGMPGLLSSEIPKYIFE